MTRTAVIEVGQRFRRGGRTLVVESVSRWGQDWEFHQRVWNCRDEATGEPLCRTGRQLARWKRLREAGR